jgi:hypothetical protein
MHDSAQHLDSRRDRVLVRDTPLEDADGVALRSQRSGLAIGIEPLRQQRRLQFVHRVERPNPAHAGQGRDLSRRRAVHLDDVAAALHVLADHTPGGLKRQPELSQRLGPELHDEEAVPASHGARGQPRWHGSLPDGVRLALRIEDPTAGAAQANWVELRVPQHDAVVDLADADEAGVESAVAIHVAAIPGVVGASHAAEPDRAAAREASVSPALIPQS